MLKRQHVFIRSSLAFTTIDDSPAFLSKLQTPLFAALQQTFELTQNGAELFWPKCHPEGYTSGR